VSTSSGWWGGGGWWWGGWGFSYVVSTTKATEVAYLDPAIRESLRKTLSISRKSLQAIKNWEQYQLKIEDIVKNMTNKQLATAYTNLSKLSNHKTVKNNKEFFAYFWDLMAYEIFLKTWGDVRVANTLSSAKTDTTIAKVITEKSSDLTTLSKALILSKYVLQNIENWKKLQIKVDTIVRNMSLEKLEETYNNLSTADMWRKEATNYYKDLVSYQFHLNKNNE
jgi:hypothetical protein